jgi:hypothetical protein
MLGFSLYAMWPNPLNNLDTDEDEDDEASSVKDGKSVEMSGLKTTWASGTMPYTPRTQAFHTLDRKLPLRQHETMLYS